MYSVIGLLRRGPDQNCEQFRTWWLDSHVPTVMQMPGLLDYRLWTIDEAIDQRTLDYSQDAPFDGVAVITFASREAFEAVMVSSEGRADNDSFNSGAPVSTVLGGIPYVFRDGEIAVTSSTPSGKRVEPDQP